MELEDEAQALIAEGSPLRFGQALDALAADGDGSTGGLQQKPDDREQRRLPGTGRTEQRDQFAGIERQVDAFEDVRQFVAIAERHFDSARIEHRGHCWIACSGSRRAAARAGITDASTAPNVVRISTST